jgi:Holliday junction resolvase RusA-like endonuclease
VEAESASLDPDYPAGFPGATATGAAASLRLFIPGKPIPKGRPRSKVIAPKDGRKPFVQVYSEDETVAWEETVAWIAKRQILSIPPDEDGEFTLPFEGRVVMTLRFNLERPKSYPKSVLYPTKSRSDVDNLAKSVMDGLQKGRILANDNLVTDLMIIKRYAEAGHPEGVEIDLTSVTRG